jgi:hypothetical protein
MSPEEQGNRAIVIKIIVSSDIDGTIRDLRKFLLSESVKGAIDLH